MKRTKLFTVIVALLIATIPFFLVSCTEPEDPIQHQSVKDTTSTKLVRTKMEKGYYRFSIQGEGLPAGQYAIMSIETSDGLSKDITIMLLPEYAPKTVKNFISYIESDYYDGTVIHRIVPSSYVFQGGGYKYKNSAYSQKSNSRSAIDGEFADNSYSDNIIGHFAGAISMARTDSSYNSATSQFFISWDDFPSWDGSYAAFGFLPYQEDIYFIKNIGETTTTDTSGQPTSRIITLKDITYSVIK